MAISFLIAILLLSTSIRAQDETPPEPIDPTTVNAGPFVSWLTDSTLQIERVCAGQLEQQVIAIDSQAVIPLVCLRFLPGELIITRHSSVPTQTQFNNVSQLMAVSDIHGEYEYLCDFLKTTEIVDDSLNWSWGEGHLVFNGDIFDRGDKVFETLWLIYRLQQQAVKAGGMVHFTLGNHELMVLRGDERYLSRNYTEVVVPTLKTTHQALVEDHTILGDWLRLLPTMIVIDSILFVHGGISMDLIHSGMTRDEINTASLAYLDISSDSLKADSLASLLYRSQGPFWNRTMVWEYKQPQITPIQLDTILDYFGARAVVVGHSEHDSLTSLFDGRLFAIDIPVDDAGGFEALLFENNQFFRVTPDGQRHQLD